MTPSDPVGRPSHRVPDADLVRRCQQGDERAFRDIYDRHSGRVHAVAVRMLVDRRDAEEVTQDTFAAAWRHLPGFRGDSAFSTWLHRICLNRCTSVLRRRPRPEVALDRVDGRRDPRPGPAEITVLRHDVDQVQAALHRLSEATRTALVLREVAQLSYAEVAEVQGLTLTAVRSRIHRGRTALLRDLDGATSPPAAEELACGA